MISCKKQTDMFTVMAKCLCTHTSFIIVIILISHQLLDVYEKFRWCGMTWQKIAKGLRS